MQRDTHSMLILCMKEISEAKSLPDPSFTNIHQIVFFKGFSQNERLLRFLYCGTQSAPWLECLLGR